MHYDLLVDALMRDRMREAADARRALAGRRALRGKRTGLPRHPSPKRGDR